MLVSRTRVKSVCPLASRSAPSQVETAGKPGQAGAATHMAAAHWLERFVWSLSIRSGCSGRAYASYDRNTPMTANYSLLTRKVCNDNLSEISSFEHEFDDYEITYEGDEE